MPIPGPVTLKTAPAGSGCFFSNSIDAEVTNNVSKFGPPNATEVICSAGIGISRTIVAFLS